MASVIENKDLFKEIIRIVPLDEEVEKRGVDLQDAGSGRKKGVCPFHGDSDPSMTLFLDDDHPHYHCFGCSEHGDVIDFVREFESRSNPDWDMAYTIKYFSDEYGIITYEEKDILKIIAEKEARRLKDKTIARKVISQSIKIRKFLSSSTNPDRELKELRMILRNIDEAIAGFRKDEVGFYLDKTNKLLKDISKIKPEFELEKNCHKCRECPLREKCRKPVYGSGNIMSGLFFIFDYPSKPDDKANRMFSSRSGEMFQRLLLMKKTLLKNYWATHSVCCYTGGREIGENAGICMNLHLKEQILMGLPSRIVLFGDMVRQILVPQSIHLPFESIIGKIVNLKVFGHEVNVVFNYEIEAISNPDRFPIFQKILNSALNI